MLRLAKSLWNDQAGFVVSAELVLISTVGVIGLGTGLTCLRNAVNSELSEVGCAISALDQSYCYTGFHGYKDPCGYRIKAQTAGSSYQQNRHFVADERFEEEQRLREEEHWQGEGRLHPTPDYDYERGHFRRKPEHDERLHPRHDDDDDDERMDDEAEHERRVPHHGEKGEEREHRFSPPSHRPSHSRPHADEPAHRGRPAE